MNSLDCSVKEEVDVGHFRVVEGHSLFFFLFANTTMTFAVACKLSFYNRFRRGDKNSL